MEIDAPYCTWDIPGISQASRSALRGALCAGRAVGHT